MRMHCAVAAMLVAAVSVASEAQTGPKLPPCDPAGVLIAAKPVFGVGTTTLKLACPSYDTLVAVFGQQHPEFAAAVQALRHGFPVVPIQPLPEPPPKDTVVPPPKDTAVTPPIVTVPIGYVALANTTPMGALTASTVYVPLGWTGRSVADIQPGGGCKGPTECKTGEGANRFLCAYANMRFDDPIVFPGEPGKSHLHQFFGNTHVNAFTTTDSIATTGNSTCSGGIANRTGYWTPAMVDAMSRVVPPARATIYYKSGYQMRPSSVQVLPTGLKMIAGDKNWTNVSQNQARVWWTCDGGPGPSYSATIPDCSVRVELIVIFPQCWDGKRLDSPDHKSHMSYPIYSNATNGSVCPTTYPVVVPEITEEFFWPVPSGARSSTWHISSDMDLTKPGGLSAHADWMMGWQPDVMKTFVTLCLDLSKDCQVNGLGNNTYLNPPPN
jgi:hypothetical protein